jgi:CubicO group peptidase (beta-lactamase class C family)
VKLFLSIILLAVVIVLAPLTTAAAQPAANGEIDFAALDAAVEAQMRKHGLPGVALAVVEDGEIVYLQGYGAAGRGQAMTPQTQMLIGSQSKSFTALAIAQLAEQGKIDLNAPVQAYITVRFKPVEYPQIRVICAIGEPFFCSTPNRCTMTACEPNFFQPHLRTSPGPP